MIIGFIGFGRVSENLTILFRNEKIISSDYGRSKQSINRMKKANVEILDDFNQVAIESDLLISANSPSQALELASEYGSKTKGIFLDLNNISPETSEEINKTVDNFVDGAIIGKVESSPMIYLSGEKADQLVFLNSYLPVKIISDKIGDASRLKLLRSIYTKTVSTTLIETMEIAKEFNLEKEVLETIAYSEGDAFINSALSRIKNTKNSSSRKEEELEEIISYFNNVNDLTMTRATYKKLKRI